MMWVGDKKEVILLMQKPRSRWYALCCIGRKAHYRKDGTCKHTDQVMENVKPGMRDRVKIDPWGGAKKRGASQPDGERGRS